jgi:hypothetical protein
MLTSGPEKLNSGAACECIPGATAIHAVMTTVKSAAAIFSFIVS